MELEWDRAHDLLETLMSPKRIDNRAVTGQKGIALIERIALKMGLAWHARNASLDAGIDGLIEIRDAATQRATNCILQVQSKATSGAFTAETESGFEFLCDERDVAYWLGGNVPVIIIVSRPDKDEAYWKSVREAFPSIEAQRERRIRFSKAEDRLDESARSKLVSLAVPRSSGLYFPPVPRREDLYTNLLKVETRPERLFIAPTEFRRPEAIYARARDNDWDIPREWILTDGNILSLHDLREEPLRQLCESAATDEFEAAEWSLSDDPDRTRQFVRLLNQALRVKLRPRGVGFDPKHGVYWFFQSLTPGHPERSYSYHSKVKQASRDVVKAYYRPDGTVKYCRHCAFEGGFERLGDDWYLAIAPTYRFTRDGRMLHTRSGALLQGIKKVEKHLAVRGHLITWLRFLTQTPGLFEKPYPFLRFGTLQQVEMDAGIDDNMWLDRETPDDREAATRGADEGLFA